MLPPGGALRRGAEFFALRRGLPASFDDAAIALAAEEAEQLAAGREQDEPAALFLACARRPRLFGPATKDVVPHLVRTHARVLGYELALLDVEADILRIRVLHRAITWDELRDELARRLRPRS